MTDSTHFEHQGDHVYAETNWRTTLYVEVDGHPVADIIGDCTPDWRDCKTAARLDGAALQSFWRARLKERAIEAFEDWKAYQAEEWSCA